jgi:hypothetical protein
MTENYLKDRANRGDRTKYETILAKVPDVEPEEYDKIQTVEQSRCTPTVLSFLSSKIYWRRLNFTVKQK